MANRNRTAGLNYERQIIKELKTLGFSAVSSRSESRYADAQGIDIISDFPLKIQCKNTQNNPDYHKILNETEADVIFHKKTKKNITNFVPLGEYVIMKKHVFLEHFIEHN